MSSVENITKHRHPEKINKPENPYLKKPDWIRVKAPTWLRVNAVGVRWVARPGLELPSFGYNRIDKKK